ncbi:class I SAM-dependent methyltransferase [Devosia albogilva]|uniref:Class I SAM-dependent methyltransferase n=1 Tax=Devosia albogilva TaxID=429726 RepID=A0ABW5QLL8_9HYPH
MPDLYDDPELYDLVAPRDEAMEQFYVEVAGGHSRKVLELACGSGRLTVPLAKSGALVTAGDISAMLDRAEAAARESAVDVSFVELDMRDFDLGTKFDVVVIAANSLMHLNTTEDLVRAMSAARRHLAPGGIFAFDIFVPSPSLLSLPSAQRRPVGVFPHKHLGEVTVEETITYDPVSQVSQADWYWSTKLDPTFRRTTIHMRQIYPQEMPLLLQLGGLTLASRFGDFVRQPLDPESWRQVCLCR